MGLFQAVAGEMHQGAAALIIVEASSPTLRAIWRRIDNQESRELMGRSVVIPIGPREGHAHREHLLTRVISDRLLL